MLLRRFFNASVYIRRLWHGLDFSGVPILIHIAKGEARRRENLGGDKVAVGTGRHAAGQLQHGGGFARDVLGVEDQEFAGVGRRAIDQRR